ncbi:hypothetical protein [Yimella sp. NH-Cas1]|uniref:hypothetical protein n=1 Tax=Yimella sp. NH-Cas1 TaxID=2917726 RepID=UPI001EFA5218|nr:hypothetical protein [Yimella sp. NH-Cas1]MCG8656768.1 hypothetical protein [Yimella sp. NH-Cas1]
MKVHDDQGDPDQVDNAKLLLALDKARGRTSAEWLIRLANAKQAQPPTDEDVSTLSAQAVVKPAD